MRHQRSHIVLRCSKISRSFAWTPMISHLALPSVSKSWILSVDALDQEPCFNGSLDFAVGIGRPMARRLREPVGSTILYMSRVSDEMMQAAR